jgi:hypothetical protein
MLTWCVGTQKKRARARATQNWNPVHLNQMKQFPMLADLAVGKFLDRGASCLHVQLGSDFGGQLAVGVASKDVQLAHIRWLDKQTELLRVSNCRGNGSFGRETGLRTPRSKR